MIGHRTRADAGPHKWHEQFSPHGRIIVSIFVFPFILNTHVSVQWASTKALIMWALSRAFFFTNFHLSNSTASTVSTNHIINTTKSILTLPLIENKCQRSSLEITEKFLGLSDTWRGYVNSITLLITQTSVKPLGSTTLQVLSDLLKD